MAGAAAQEVPSEARTNAPARGQVRLEGKVLNARTGEPVPMARIELPELGRKTVADAVGRYRIDRVPPGEHVVRVGSLGFKTVQRIATAGAGAGPLEVRLEEDAIVLEGLTAVADRFTRRLRSYPYQARTIDQATIHATAAVDASRLVALRGGVITAACGRSGSETCVRVRGQTIRPVVYLDEARLPGGMRDLAAYSAGEVARVEVLRRGTEIRVYTQRFVEWAARNGYQPQPFIIGAQ